MPSPLLLPLLTASAVLLISGAAKVRDPASVDQAFTSMHVPAALDRPFLRRLLPWAEIALGAWLLLASGAALALVGVLTLGLFLAYLVLVVLAVRRPEPADCGCFGAVGDSEVTMATVWRNVLLVLTAALVVVAGLRDVSVIRTGLEGSAWGWVAASVLTTAVAVLVVWRPTDTHATTAANAATAQPELDEDGDFVPTPAPRAAVLDEHGTPVLLNTAVLSS
ncbi:MAG: MauE/DoxX family redox-associated membrane protein, partial [Ornithinibacter sp.]